MATNEIPGSGAAPGPIDVAPPAQSFDWSSLYPTMGGSAPAAPPPPSQPEPQPAPSSPGVEPPAGPEGAAAARAQALLELQLPDGFDPQDPHFARFRSRAGELGLPREVAQELLELHTSVLQGQSESQAREVASWEQKTRADPEIGGEGLQGNVALAREVLEEFGSVAFVRQVEKTWMGNNPEFIRFAVRVGKALRAAKTSL